MELVAEVTVRVSTWALVAMGAILLAAEAFTDTSVPRALILAPFILVLVDTLAGISSPGAAILRILHVSDPHYDFDPSGVRDVVQSTIHNQDFDAVACTGDIANNEADCAEFLGWFSDVKVPKYLVPGNHDLWWTRKPRTTLNTTVHDGFGGHAQRNGWKTPRPDALWDVVDNVLLFNVFYTPEPAWDSLPRIAYERGQGGNDLTYSADHRHIYRFEELVRRDIPEPEKSRPVNFSLSHLSPSDAIPSRYAPQVCFVNNQILRIAQAFASPLHLYGHTHEPQDTTVFGTRVVNCSWMDADYRLNPPADLVVRHA